ncbi:MAG: 4Fe-4S binding protein [Rectinema sp.]|jgi:polyferredoxin
MARKIEKIQLGRRISLGVFFVAFTVLTILHQKVENMPSVDSLCPFGGIETLFKYIAGGELVKKIMPSNLVLLVAIIILGVALSRFFCGWICAFGALQGIFGWIGKKLFKKRRTVPKKLDQALRWIKYPLLVGIVYFTWTTGTLIIRPYDPLAAYAHLSTGIASVWAEFAVGLVILIVVLVLSTLYERAFCKYLCPLGAVISILGRIPLFRIKRESSTCISCSKCDRVCPMNIDVSTVKTITSPECIGCMECVTACPTKKSTLYTTLAGKKVKTGTIVIVGLAIYLGALGVGALTGKLDFVGPSLTDEATKGTLKIEDIRGSSTWEEIAESFNVSLIELYKAANVDETKVPPDTKLKDTGALIGRTFEADEVRIALATLLGISYSGENGTTPSSPVQTVQAVETAQSAPAVPEKIIEPTEAAKPATSAEPVAPVAPAVSEGALAVPEGFVLEGTMTIKDIATALNVPEAKVIEKLQLPADISVTTPLRDMKDQYGYTMTALKERFAQ